MTAVPKPGHVIVRKPFLNDDLGEVIARHDDEGPTIDVVLAPQDSGASVSFGLTPCETRLLARQLQEVADTAQRAGWTPAVLADVRESYLPRASDEQIVARLDDLAERLGASPLGLRPGTLSPEAGRMLVAGAGRDVLQQAIAALDTAIARLAEFSQTTGQLTDLRAAFDELRRFYEAESENPR